MTWTVYRLLDEQDQLLYVGCTGQPMQRRLREHRRTQPWSAEIAGFCAEPYSDERDARQAELEAIDSESPRYNIRRGYLPAPPSQLTEEDIQGALDGLLGPEQTGNRHDDLWAALVRFIEVREQEKQRQRLIARAMRRNGLSWREMSSNTGVPVSTLRTWVKAAS